MFVTTIREQASDEQKAYWLPKIESWSIIGAYAQVQTNGIERNEAMLILMADRTWARE